MHVGLIPRAFIDEVLSRTDIVEFIDGFVPLKKQGNNHIACCPFHNEKSPSFNVSANKQFYHCFGCGTSGNAISFAMNYSHLSFPDAIESLATRLGLTVPHEGQREQNKSTLNLYQFLTEVSNFYQQTLKSNGQPAIAYLTQRRVSSEIAQRYQIGYAPPGWQTLESQFKKNKKELITSGMLIKKEDGQTYDRYRQRIMFPIHDRRGRLIGFGGRAIEVTQKPKYLNSPETIIFQKSRELYGLHQLLQQQSTIKNIVIVEGYLDVIALAQHGVLNTVATLGTATSGYHIQLLSKYTQQLIFCFDGDAAGRKAAWRALESCLPYLNNNLDARFIFLPEGDDPDSLIHQEGKEKFLNRVNHAMPLSQFFIDTLTREIDTSTLSGKSQFINLAKPFLLKITDGPYKELLMSELARLTHIDQHRIHQLVEEKTIDTTTQTNQHIKRSPVRIAIAILLQHPTLYINALPTLSAITLDSKKQRVLKTIIGQIEANPTIRTAQLVELWRDTAIFEAITQLATWNLQISNEALTKELIDILAFIAKQNKECIIQQLLKKTLKEGLTESERHLLQNMLRERHHINTIKKNSETKNKLVC